MPEKYEARGLKAFIKRLNNERSEALKLVEDGSKVRLLLA